MKSTPRTQSDSLSPVDAIAILNDWGSRGLFRGKNFGTSIHLQSIEPTPCYHFCGCTQYERRSVRRAISPYYGGKIDDTGTPPSMWDMTVERPRHEFVNTSKNIPVPHTERLLTCEECRGNRRIECALCEGSGQEPCRQCHGGRISCNGCGGSGSVQGQVTEYVYNYQTNSSDMETRYVMHSCNSCGGCGSFSCNNCNGSGCVVCALCDGDGDLRCETCDEQGKVREYKLLNVVFEYQSNSETIGALEIPDEKLKQVAGIEIFQKEEDTITSLDGINDPRLTNHAREFLSQFTPSSSIMLYQELTITKIPVFKVAYKKHFAGKQKVLWIYGNQHQVYFDGQWEAPKNLKKVAMVALALSAAGVAGAGGFALLNQRGTETTYDPPSDTMAEAASYCNGFHIEDRRIALNFREQTLNSAVDAQFHQKYPDFTDGIDTANDAHAPYRRGWCDIADAWLKERETASTTTAPPQSPSESLPDPPDPALMEAQAACKKVEIDDRLARLNIGKAAYASQVDKAFRSRYPDFQGAIDKTSPAHASYLTSWCEIADGWLTEQESSVSSGQSEKESSTGVIKPSDNVCSQVAYLKRNEKTGEMDAYSPCEDINSPP